MTFIYAPDGSHFASRLFVDQEKSLTQGIEIPVFSAIAWVFTLLRMGNIWVPIKRGKEINPMKTYRYDIAISFAEEDRNAALALSLALEMAGFNKVYYYPFNYEATWGKEIERELDKIYSEKSKYAIAFFSNTYLKKRFSTIEREAIFRRIESSADMAYMLPVVLPGFAIEKYAEFTKFGYMMWDYNPKEIALVVAKVLGKPRELIEKKKPPMLRDLYIVEGGTIESDNIDIGRGDAENTGARPKKVEVINTRMKSKNFRIG